MKSYTAPPSLIVFPLPIQSSVNAEHKTSGTSLSNAKSIEFSTITLIRVNFLTTLSHASLSCSNDVISLKYPHSSTKRFPDVKSIPLFIAINKILGKFI